MTDAGARPRLSLGPVLYFWSRQTLDAFYAEVESWPLDIVYLGETVCAKRRSYTLDDWLETARRLEAAGKEVVLSSLALIEAESELKALERLCSNGRLTVEANDLAAVRMLEGRVPFVAGPAINIYNPRTLEVLTRSGLRRWVLPVELSRRTLSLIQAGRPEGVETELFAYGRMPLAYSARCFTARAHGLPKDDCGFRCLDHPDGLTLQTREGEPFLAVNGIQTQSARTHSLLGELRSLDGLGVDVLRISPQSAHTGRVVRAFREALDRRIDPAEAARAAAAWMPSGPCDGYWRDRPGIER